MIAELLHLKFEELFHFTKSWLPSKVRHKTRGVLAKHTQNPEWGLTVYAY